LESCISHFSKINQTVILLEKAEFLVLGARLPEARSIVMECNKNLQDKARIDNLGRLLFIFMQINEWDFARKILLESIKNNPTLGKLLSLAIVLFLTNPIFINLLFFLWLALWFIIPINTISTIAIIVVSILLGICIIYSIKQGNILAGVLISLFAIITLIFYYLKTFDIYIQGLTWVFNIILFIIVSAINGRRFIVKNK
jgi:hypothetical protein